jgi:hypothetical protein
MVHPGFILKNLFGQLAVLLDHRGDAAIKSHQRAHRQKLAPQLLQFLFKVALHGHPLVECSDAELWNSYF